MESDKPKIFLLSLKKSRKHEDTTYCIGVYNLGTPNMEFILGETDNCSKYRVGEEVSYIWNADYTGNLQDALNWLNRVK